MVSPAVDFIQRLLTLTTAGMDVLQAFAVHPNDSDRSYRETVPRTPRAGFSSSCQTGCQA
jgi:hypothetical protein